MKRIIVTLSFTVSTLFFHGPANADPFVVQPVQTGVESVRYQQGAPAVDITMPHGMVEVRPMALDHGSLTFSVAVVNGGSTPANIDTGNFSIKAGDQTLSPFTVQQLMDRAKSRATWSKIGLGVVGALGSAAAASERDTYNASVVTPYGIYTEHASVPSVAGQIQADHISDMTADGLNAIQARLDATRAQLGNDIIQTSTVDPGRFQGGKLIFEKLRDTSLPQRITLYVAWNGDQYAFTFQLAKPGTPAPPVTYSAPRVPTATAPVTNPEPAAAPAVATMPAAEPAPAVMPAAYMQPVQPALAPAQPTRFAAAAGAAPGYGANAIPAMAQVVQRTALGMPHPTTLADGTMITNYDAEGSTLIVTTNHHMGRAIAVEDGNAALAKEICYHKAFMPIIAQGGAVEARSIGADGRAVTMFTLDRQQCGL